MTHVDRSDPSLLERIKIQVEMILPLLRALRTEIGKDRANAIVYGTLRETMRTHYREMGAHHTGSRKQVWKQMTRELAQTIGDDVDVEHLRNDDTRLEFNVTGCRYAEFFQALGEPELGTILACEIDDHIAQVGSQEVHFDRPTAIMTGHGECRFRYRFRESQSGGE